MWDHEGQTAPVGIEAELRDQHGQPVRELDDPAGGTFDAAGEFDALLPQAPDAPPHPPQAGYSLLGQVNPYGNTVFHPEQMVDLLLDIEIARSQATTRRQQRGLERLAVLAEACRASTHLVICFVGD